MNLSTCLRNELAARARLYADSKKLPYCLSYGEPPVVCFPAGLEPFTHGNFIPQSYEAILANPNWRKRLAKVHTHERKSLPPSVGDRWRELDSCMSSDALLMNIFCHPSLWRSGLVQAWLGLDKATELTFGFKARVPLANGRFDRTEVDLQAGNLYIEAKLTEVDFQRARKNCLAAYRDFADVFDLDLLPQTEDHYGSYQLLRNVLAAHAAQSSFCVLLDGRRSDLIQAWYAVMRCVIPVNLRTRLRVMTWQELAAALPQSVRDFLAEKYGI